MAEEGFNLGIPPMQSEDLGNTEPALRAREEPSILCKLQKACIDFCEARFTIMLLGVQGYNVLWIFGYPRIQYNDSLPSITISHNIRRR